MGIIYIFFSIPKITPPVAGENPCKGQDENPKWLDQFILMHETINLIYNEQVKFLRIKRDFTRFVLYSYYLHFSRPRLLLFCNY